MSINEAIRRRLPFLTFLVCLAAAGSRAAEVKLTPTPAVAGDQFGEDVAIDNGTAVVGALLAETDGYPNTGSVHVFNRNGGSWPEQGPTLDSLVNDSTDPLITDLKTNDHFGIWVDISGQRIVVGASGRNSSDGVAYVFRNDGSSWVLDGIPLEDTSVGNTDGLFGQDVAISGDTIIVGASAENISGVSGGRSFIFDRGTGTWLLQKELHLLIVPPNGDTFGSSVDIDGDTAIVGAQFHDVASNSDAGAAYVFVRNSGVWSLQQELVAGVPASNDQFGNAVGISGDIAVVGAFRSDINGSGDAGAAYIYTRIGTGWSQEPRIEAPDGLANDQFGQAVAIDGDTIIVGTQQGDAPSAPNAGAAYVFKRDGAGWSFSEKLVASDAATGDNFGHTVDASGGTFVVGSRLDDDAGTNSGAAYVFEPSVFEAVIDIDPDTLNRRSHGQWITAYISLPSGLDVANIIHSTIEIVSLIGESCNPNYTQLADLNFVPQVGDRDEDGILDLTVKFSRQALLDSICLDDVGITVEADLTTGEHIGGTDFIRVINRGKP